MTSSHDKPQSLGWCLATFLLESVEPTNNGSFGSAELFQHYRRWCAAKHLVPYLEAEFVEQIGKLAAEAQIPLKQSGANVVLMGVRPVSQESHQ